MLEREKAEIDTFNIASAIVPKRRRLRAWLTAGLAAPHEYVDTKPPLGDDEQ
jgi:hypothetical protein